MKTFENAIEWLASGEDEYPLSSDSITIRKKRGCCIALSWEHTIYDDFFKNLFTMGAWDNRLRPVKAGYWMEFFDESIEDAYTSRVMALQLAQCLWDDGQTTNSFIY